LTWFCR